MTSHQPRASRRTFLQYAAVLGAGVAAGTALRGNVSVSRLAGAASPVPADATATREAELQELNDLRTQVANPPVCTPAPTETPPPPTATATQAPLSQTGVPIPYLDIWTITVLAIAPTPGTSDAQPTGTFMQVNFDVSHQSREPELLSFTDFVLIDEAGGFSNVDASINRELLGVGWALTVDPGVTETRSVIFDVAADAGNSFILESTADATFRVALTVEQRG